MFLTEKIETPSPESPTATRLKVCCIRDVLAAAGETLELNETEEEYSEPYKKAERVAGSSKSKSFNCKECGTSYANFYYDAAKNMIQTGADSAL